MSEINIKADVMASLNEQDYCIVGDGDYVVELITKIKALNYRLPQKIFVRTVNPALPAEIQEPESEIAKLASGRLLMGSNAFHVEIMLRIDKFNVAKLPYFSLLDVDQNIAHPANYSLNDEQIKSPYLLFVSINPIRHHDLFVHQFFKHLARKNIKIIVKHPLQHMEEGLLKGALAVIIWSGAMAVHQSFIERCRSLNIRPTYGECGFFPQAEYYYFDKSGVNNQSQLNNDDLSWVSPEHLNKLERVRQTFFENVVSSSCVNFIFVPLQVPNDSNILTNSRFNSGMQEFIDLIEEKYKGEKIVFKAHPKDRMKSTYVLKHGIFSEEDSRSLILSAKLVHGINSSVLFEAVLAQKPVIADGECLLNSFPGDTDKLLAAMIERQFSVHSDYYEEKKISRFTHFSDQFIEVLVS